ncbi:unnamed protein product, partial [Tilletia laevis]
PISHTEAQTLMFSKAALTDDEANSIRDPAEIARLGEISIVMQKVKSRYQMKRPVYSTVAIGPKQAIYERAKKVGAVQLGAGPVIQALAAPRSIPINDTQVPAVKFRVHCATRLGLQLLDYIPKEEDTSTSIPSKKRSREEEELEVESQRLKNQLEEVEKRRRVLADAESSRNAGSSAQAEEAPLSVKRERAKFDFSRGGTANDPLTIADLSD